MKADYLVHDRLYKEARAKGWNGWGGNDRIAYEHRWVEHLFSYDEIPKMGEVLELGCGEGHLARLLAEKGYRVLGVDISATAIQWAREKTLDTGLKTVTVWFIWPSVRSNFPPSLPQDLGAGRIVF